jgi:hypothetical protein
MYISKFEVNNYKIYRASGELEFKPGFNIITGQNSAGKTVLLEALALGFQGNPHRSEATIPVEGGVPPPESSVRITFVITRDELLRIVSGEQHNFPAPTQGTLSYDGSPGSFNRFLEWLLRQSEFRISVRFTRSVGGGGAQFVEGDSLGIYRPAEPLPNDVNRTFVQVVFDPAGNATSRAVVTMHPNHDVSFHIAARLQAQIYRFSAERFSLGESPFGTSSVLSADASNLPEVLFGLNANTTRFLRLSDLLHEVLPQVQHVSVRPIDPNKVQILVWPHPRESARRDLTVSLNECGSGVGQVLAILYVVLTATTPQTIIIDEPQSFLHPGAVRKLIEVLKRYPQHQYIFATHSPTVIVASEPSTLAMIQIQGVEARLQSLSTNDSKELQLCLADIGARLSDVFGADNILWVEGQTEEISFPIILKSVAGVSLMGTAIVGIRQTGDLEGREAKRIFELYRRLSHASTLLPPAVAFVLDSECKTPEEMAELRQLSGHRAVFLHRRMLENYLLVPSAIAAVANKIEGFRDTPIRDEEVGALIQAMRQDTAYFCRGTTQIPADWAAAIDGAKVLRDIFRELSCTRVSFEKTTHSVAIVEWVIKNQPQHLEELQLLLVSLLQPAGANIPALSTVGPSPGAPGIAS